MTLSQIETFIEVVRTGSMGQAAKKLFLSQPAVTQHIQKLERELQCELFDRDNKKLSLTHSGKAFLRYAEYVQNEYGNCINTIKRIREGMIGGIDFVTTAVAGEYILPPILNEFKSRYTFIDATVQVVDQTDVVHEVLCGNGKLGIIGLPKNKSREEKAYDLSRYPELRGIRIGKDENVFITYTGHPLTRKGSIQISDLIGETIVIKEIPRFVELAKLGLDLENYRPRIITDTIGGVTSMVRAKLGVGYIPLCAAKKNVRDGYIQVLDIKDFSAYRDIYFIYKKDLEYSALTSSFIRFIEEYSMSGHSDIETNITTLFKKQII